MWGAMAQQTVHRISSSWVNSRFQTQFDPNFCWKLCRLWSCPFTRTHGLEIAIPQDPYLKTLSQSQHFQRSFLVSYPLYCSTVDGIDKWPGTEPGLLTLAARVLINSPPHSSSYTSRNWYPNNCAHTLAVHACCRYAMSITCTFSKHIAKICSIWYGNGVPANQPDTNSICPAFQMPEVQCLLNMW